MTTVVTLSSSKDKSVTAVPVVTSVRKVLPPLSTASSDASHSNPPVGIMIATMVIIAASRKITFQSMAATACCGE